MTLRCEVLSIETVGDNIHVTCQATGSTDAKWRPMRRVQFDVRDCDAKRYHVGRIVNVTVSPA